MKRLLMVLVVLGTLAVSSRAAAQQIPVGLGTDLSSLVGLPIDVPFVVDMSARSERLGSFALRIQWDTTKLRFIWGTDGSFGSTQVNADSLAFGVVRLAGVNPAGAAGRVTLATARMTPLVRDTTTLRLSLGELYAAGTFADLLPSAVVTDGAYCPARGRWGDIDGDGNANSRDALIALSNAVGLDVSAFDIGLGDVDGSGTANARDALVILSNAVGVDVSAFRVLRLATGACAANAARALTIVPGGLELVAGQQVRFEARAGDSAGVLQAITDVTWASDRPAVLGVMPDGSALARDTGTAVVTVRRGASDSARTTVHVVARRTTHWVDAQAAGATNRLGTSSQPFGTLNEGVHFARPGDTVRVRLGVYDLNRDGDGTFHVSSPIVVIGDTAVDGSRPALAGSAGNDAVVFDGPGSAEIHNFAITGFSTAFVVSGPSCVLIRGVRVSRVSNGVSVTMPAGCVRVEQAQMIGPGPIGEGYGGVGVEASAVVDTLTIEDTEIAGFAYGVSDGAMQVDSLTIRRSVLHDAGYSAVSLSGYCYDCVTPGPGAARPAGRASRTGGAAPPLRGPQDGPPTSQAVVVEASRLARSNDALVYLSTSLRHVLLSHSVFANPGRDVLSVSSNGAGYLSLTGDSVVATPDGQSYRWLDVRDLDSLDIDSVVAVGFQYGDVYRVPLVRMSNATLRDVRGHGLQVSPASGGAVLRFDNVGIYGDPRDDLSANGLDVSGARATIHGLTAVNLYEGVYAAGSDSSVTVTNSLFQHVEYPVGWYPNRYPAPDSSGLTVRNTTFRGFYSAIETHDGTLVADSNTFVGGYTAIDAGTPRAMTVTRNRISGTEYGVDLVNYDSSVVVTVADNVVSGTTSTAISVGGTYYQDLQTVLDVRRNTVTCTSAGATSVTGILLLDAHVVALDNQVDGCYAGLVTSQTGSQPRNDSIVGNTVTVPASGQVGIGVTGNVTARVKRNTVTGAATGRQSYGLIDVASCPSYGNCPDSYIPSVVIDSNRVTGGTVWGIHAEYVDSLDIVANQVENLNLASGAYGVDYSADGAIAVLYTFRNFARIAGNVIRHIASNGIVIAHDGITVSVDSNVVADVDSSGISFRPNYGDATITRNLFTGARGEGLRVSQYYGYASVTGNNIAGNTGWGLRVVYPGETGVDATNNWWGDPSGPVSCPEGCTSGVGDTVDVSVNWWPPRTAPNDSVPLLPVGPAPRFAAAVRAVPPTGTAAASNQLDARIGGGEHLHAPRAASPSRSSAPPGPFAERRAAEDRDRAAFEARRAARLQQLRDRAAARLQAEALVRSRRTSSTRTPHSQGGRP
jgi:hypothetical protein